MDTGIAWEFARQLMVTNVTINRLADGRVAAKGWASGRNGEEVHRQDYI